MKKIKILFLIHDLGNGGAEKVLINLVNHIDKARFDITVVSLFGGGVNEQFLSHSVRYRAIYSKVFPGNSTLMKVFSPRQLHSLYIKEQYDIEVSYLEGPSARIISGCSNDTTKLVSWIHVEQHNMKKLSSAFRSKKEALACYNRFDKTICVSKTVMEDFCSILNFNRSCEVIYNTVESEKILELSKEDAKEIVKNQECFNLIAVASLKESKGYFRLLRVIKRLTEETYPVKLYILGKGPQEKALKEYVKDQNLSDMVTFLGYDVNPYKYVAKSDLFVCASFAEGFSTAATESLIVGTPVCTVEVSGMKEMLGENNEYGVVTANSEESLYDGIKSLLNDPAKLAHYKAQAVHRSKIFYFQETVSSVETMLLNLVQEH